MFKLAGAFIHRLDDPKENSVFYNVSNLLKGWSLKQEKLNSKSMPLYSHFSYKKQFAYNIY